MFSFLAHSILLLAQAVPSTSATNPSDSVPAVAVVETPSAPNTTQPAQALALPTQPIPAVQTPALQTSATQPSTVPTAQITVNTVPDAGKGSIVKGTIASVDTVAGTINVKPLDGSTPAVAYKVNANVIVTLDTATSNLAALGSIGAGNVTMTTDSIGAVTSIVAISPPWWAKIMNQTNPIFLMIIPLGFFMLLSVRNKKKQERAQQEKLGSIKRGDRIQTIGGIMGNVVQTEDTRILVKVDESNNTKIWFTRAAVARVVGEEKSDVKTK